LGTEHDGEGGRHPSGASDSPDLGWRVGLGRDSGRIALVVDGVVQSVALERPRQDDRGLSYWAAVIPDARPESALVLGLAGGTVVHLLHERFGALPVVGVEHNPAVVALAREHFGLGELEANGLEVVVGDAFEYVASCDRVFDLVVVDLYNGLQPARGFLAKPFLRRVRALLSPGGLAVFNLVLGRRLPKQLHRLMEVYPIVRPIDVDFDVVVHCRAR
jgi:spermidine synthase